MHNIKPGTYKHYKGTLARVLGTALHTETKEAYVVYEHPGQETGEKTLWVRPLQMFCETVIVKGKSVPRFTYIGE